MQAVDLLISARWTLPIEPEGAVLEDYSVAIHEGRIIELGPTAVLCGRYAPDVRVSRPSHVLLPGFVDAQTSASRSLLRDTLAQSSAHQPFGSALQQLEKRWVSAEFVRAGTLHGIAGMLRAGITCFADVSLFPEEVAPLASELQMRIAVGVPVIDGPTPWAESAADCLDRASALWDEHKSGPWARLYFAPDPPGEIPDAILQRLRRMSDQLDAPVAMRLHERVARPLTWLATEGLLRPGFTISGNHGLLDEEMDLIARTGVGFVHCPKSTLRLGQLLAPVGGLRSRGVRTGLGTGFAAAALGLPDLLAEAQLAALLSGTPATISGAARAAAALRMATLEGAQVLGLDEEIGSIIPGKSADLVCIDLSASSVDSASRVPEALLFDGSSRDVTDAWIAGRPHLEQRQLRRLDVDRVSDFARQWSARMGAGGSR